MTPAIQIATQHFNLLADSGPNPGIFDVTDIPNLTNEIDLSFKPENAVSPYQDTMLVGLTKEGNGAIVTWFISFFAGLDEKGHPTIVAGDFECTVGQDDHAWLAFSLVHDGERWVVTELDASQKDINITEETIKPVASIIFRFLTHLQKCGEVAHVPTSSPSNRKRIAKGKKPLYEWRTVVIQPRAPRSAHQGGTHASPRQHDRRGHWRTYKSGKRVWIKNMRVGKASNGTVFHDYEFKTGLR